MGDFWQHGPITTIHRLPGLDEDGLTQLVRKGAHARPLALLIPALASEMDGPAFPRIIGELKSVDYLSEVVLALGRASREDLLRAKRAMSELPVKGTVVWPESRNLSPVLEPGGCGVEIGPPGKGRDVWIALGYLLGRGGFHAVAQHDADIVTYGREIPLHLFAPLTHPDLRLSFCKGYYSRISGKSLAGRVTRLLVVPLLSLLGGRESTPGLRTMEAMRYALSGEFSMTMDLAAGIPMPRDWGLEVGILSSVARAVPFRAICQTDLCDNYEHKHQGLSHGDATKGLNRMAREVAAGILREAGFAPGAQEDLADRYREKALSMIPAYRIDALVNGLDYDEEKEKAAVESFAGALKAAMESTGEGDLAEPLPAWIETGKRSPGLMRRIVEAVEKDNQ
jgi:glucosyl-3-phosphoglycerate synthase